MFVYQPTFSNLVLKKERGSDYAITEKLKGLFKPKPFPLDGALLTTAKPFEYKIEIQFPNTYIVLEQTFTQPKL